MKHTYLRKTISLFVTIIMLIGLMPQGVFAAVPENQRPNNPSNNLVIGILDDSRADGIGEFPNEPSVTGYDYYYLRNDLSLDTGYWGAYFASNGGTYIDIDAFWDDKRINRNADGDAFGYYSPTGLDLAHDPFFKDGFDDVIDENTIITNWLSAESISGASPEDYELLFYVLKYETGFFTSGYHLDAKVIKKNNVTLSYDANKPAGVTADIIMPSSSSVTPGTSVTVSDISVETLVAGNLIYNFTGWNTQANGQGTSYNYQDSITVSDNITLYAQWQNANTYKVTWVNYNDAELYSKDDIPRGAMIHEDDEYQYNGPNPPERTSTSQYSYTFTGWALESGTYNAQNGITQNLVYKAQYSETAIVHKATVEVVLDGTFDAEGNKLSGSPIDIEDVENASDGSIYLKRTNNTGEPVTLERDSQNEGVYSNNAVPNGDYYIYIKSGSTYTQIGTQVLTIANADRTRYLPYYSVSYDDGVDSEEITVPETAYYYIGSSGVNVSKDVPIRDGYVFVQWYEGTNNYAPSTDILVENITNNITKPYVLTAEWEAAATVDVTVVVNHNGRESTVDEDLTIHLTAKNESTGNYNDVLGTAQVIGSGTWYTGNTTDDNTRYEAGILYTNLAPDKLYGARAAIPGYRSDTERTGGAIEITNNGVNYSVTIYLVYDPAGYELPFRVDVEAGTPERLVPKAVDVKVTRWNGTSWEVIPQHEHQTVEVVINNLTGTGSVHVWGFEGGNTDDPYLYRIEVVGIDLGDYQLTASGSDDENYTTAESGFFPAGAYTAIVEVDADILEGGLAGAHAVEENGVIVHHGEIVATVSAHPYNIELDPNGGQWPDNSTSNETIANRFTVPDLSSYVPVWEGYTFDGWYLDDMSTKITGGAYIKNYVNDVGDTLELYAKWKPDLTVKGTVVVELGYPCTDESRTVTVALQMHKGDGTYEVTEFTQSVTLTPVAAEDNEYAAGTYEFANVPDVGIYRVNVIVDGGGVVLYQNEPDSKTDANLYLESAYNAADYAAEFDGDTEAVVNIYMKASLFDLGYRADTSAIAANFRPTNLKLDLRHDHCDGADVAYEVIKDDISIIDFNNGVSDVATVGVPQYHANGYLYDYVISVLEYDIAEMGWTDRHYYHYTTTDGYYPAPFTITYNGPANYSTTPITENGSTYYQDEILTATFVPNTYNITYVMNNGSWTDATNIGPAYHTWGIETPIPDPVRTGYMFMGWTAEVAETFDGEKIPANIWQDVTLTANWERDVWKDEGDKIDEGDGIPDRYQARLIFEIEGGTWNGTDAASKNVIVTLKTKVGDEWQNVSPTPVVSGFAPDTAIAEPDVAYTDPGAWTDDISIEVPAGQSVYAYRFTPNTPTFIFDANGGAWEGPVTGYTMYLVNRQAAVTVAYNTSIEIISETPVRTGYTFDGWYSMENGEYTTRWWEDTSTTYPVTANTIVYAKWNKIPVNGTLNVVLQDEDGNVLQTENPIPIVDDYKVSADGDSDYVILATITNGADNYIYEAPAVGSDDLIGTVETEGQAVNVILQYTKDNWNDSGDDDEGGDGIADKQQVKITYASNNTSYGTVDKSLDIITLSGSDPENVDASANATTQGGQTYFIDWKIGGTTVSTSTALAYTIENATGGSSYDFVANFGINTGGGGGGVTRYALTYETNGGDNIPKEYYNRGVEVEVTKVPKKDGYVFDGWYLDKDLTEEAKTVKMTKNITVYAAWVEDNGSAGTGYPTPGGLNGDDHFAYVVGYPDGTVRPNDNITRAEVVSIFFRLLTEEVRNENLTEENQYADVASGDWYNTAISTLTHLGIVEGRTAQIFDPNAFITRAEFAAICARFDNAEFEIMDDFSDIENHWAEDEIHEAAAHGWIRGYDDNTFVPDRFITRAEAMTMINRVLNRVPQKAEDLLDGMTVWPDNSNANVWYYLPVQEATNSHQYEAKNHIYEKWTKLTDNKDWLDYEN